MSIKFENIVTPSSDQWNAILLSMRNPLNSWNKSDSKFTEEVDFDPYDYPCGFKLGNNDHDLMMRLRNAGTDHRKFMRMITVIVTITAPLYWWKEFDTYKVGTVANSCSTMHKIHAKKFTLYDFSYEHLGNYQTRALDVFYDLIAELNRNRDLYLQTKDKKYWWQMIQLLPTSYNQKRTVMLNYEVLANMYKSRKNHKLDEWRDFCEWIETLPYSELICGPSLKDVPICNEIMEEAKKRVKESAE